MRILVLSDLHLDTLEMTIPEPNADVVVLAGDIHLGRHGVEWAAENFRQPVIYVPGNHEYYDPAWTMEEVFVKMNDVAKGTNVRILDRGEEIINGVRFLGTTLWTDLLVNPVVEGGCAPLFSDAANITVGDSKPFSIECAQQIHEESIRWLAAMLKKPHNGKTVVVTHHAPSPRSIHPKYANSPWNACFVTDAEHLMGSRINLWIHGHTHNSADYMVKGTRVLCNPRGYAIVEKIDGKDVVISENAADFNPCFVVDLDG